MQRHRGRAGAEEDRAAPEADLNGRAALGDVGEEGQEATPSQRVEEAPRRAPGGEDLQPAALPRPDDDPVEGDRVNSRITVVRARPWESAMVAAMSQLPK